VRGGVQGEAVNGGALFSLNQRRLALIAKARADAPYLLAGVWAKGDAAFDARCNRLAVARVLTEGLI